MHDTQQTIRTRIAGPDMGTIIPKIDDGSAASTRTPTTEKVSLGSDPVVSRLSLRRAEMIFAEIEAVTTTCESPKSRAVTSKPYP